MRRIGDLCSLKGKKIRIDTFAEAASVEIMRRHSHTHTNTHTCIHEDGEWVRVWERCKVCVCERERKCVWMRVLVWDREGMCVLVWNWEKVYVCVYVCDCKWKRKRDRKRGPIIIFPFSLEKMNGLKRRFSRIDFSPFLVILSEASSARL